jgi:demethylmenaquinone methyltransferase/2-methoxy-6-polyprenyl-1,4-benzoquinol methylase
MPTATPQRQQPELSSTAPAAPVRRGGLRLAWALLGSCIYRSFVDAAVLGFGLALVCAFALSAASSDGASPLLAALPAAGQTGALLGGQLGLLASLLQALVLIPAGLLLLAPAERWSDRHYLLGPLGAALNLGLYLLLSGALTERALPLLQSHPALWSLLNPVPALLTALLAVALPPLAALHGWRIGGALARQHALARGVALPGSADYAQLALSDPDFRRRVRAAGAVRGARALAAASLGALPRWRAQLVRRTDLRPGMRVCDLNSGDGSLWPQIMSRIGPEGRLDAVEPSPAACLAAETRLRALAPARITLHRAEPAHTDLPGGAYDAVFCAFGLRTLAVEEQAALLDEIQRLLSPNGIFGIVELAAPRQARRRRLLLSYLRHGLPQLALLLGARPAAYAPQADYIARFGQGDHLAAQLRARGFHIHRFYLSGGRAALLVGMKERPPER